MGSIAREGAGRHVFQQASTSALERHAAIARLQSLFLAGDLDGAEIEAEAVLDADPADADALNVLGMIAYRRGDFSSASKWLSQAISAHPRHAGAHSNLGAALRALGDLGPAETVYRRALDLSPEMQEAHVNLANLLIDRRKPAEAEQVLRQSVAQMPPTSNLMTTLGLTLYHQGRLVEAVTAFRRAQALDPNNYEACRNLGGALASLGRFDEAEGLHRRALSLRPDYAAGHSSLLFGLNYRPDLTSDQIFAKYREFDARHAAPLQSQHRPHANDRDSERRLRLGYVSPDFCDHVVASFMLPLLAEHDRARLEVFAYAEVRNTDAASERIKGLVDHWVSTVGLSDAALADRIRADQIDVLVDLAGHTTGNRMLTFARRPAPVQVTYFVGHGSTTGLSAFDAFLSDANLTPPGCEGVFSEPILRLNRIPLVHKAHAQMPDVGPLPALANGHVTFGHFGRAIRLNDGVIAAWSEILKRVPGSRLKLNNAPFADPATGALFAERFARQGVDPSRLDLIFTTPQVTTWAAYNEIDIALDPFPHNAGTTTVEALWMGAPVMSLADRPPVGRFGAMILSALGLDDWVAGDIDAYIAKAALAASDLDYLAEVRASLRGRFEASTLSDAPGLARAMEGGFRGLWRAWCIGADLPSRLQAGAQAFGAGDFTRANESVEAVLLTAPGNPDALHLRGLIACRQGRAADGVADLAEAILAAPNHAELRWNLAAMLRACGQFTEAVEQAEEAVRLAPDAPEAHNNLATALRDVGRIDDARASLERAVALRPNYAEALRNLAWLKAA